MAGNSQSTMQDERVRERQGEQQGQQGRSRATSQNEGLDSQAVNVLDYTTWDELDEAGAYVEEGCGALLRVPEEALATGRTPVIGRVITTRPRLFKITDDPNVTLLRARQIAANNNIQPNF